MNPELPAVPERMKRFPLWKGRYPIHFTVAKARDGTPIFREVSRSRQVEAEKKGLCHLCGLTLWAPYWFIAGDKEVEQKSLTDGPMHEECARYAIAACPFLANPNYRGNHDVREGASPKVLEWMAKHGVSGPVERPSRLALCSASRYRSNLKEQYPLFYVEEWSSIDWTAIPQKRQEAPLQEV